MRTNKLLYAYEVFIEESRLETYLTYWWVGELANHYEPFGLTMAQLNKIIKLAQYLMGLLALFELVQFSQVMQQLNFASRLYYVTNKLPYLLGIFPLLLVPKFVSGTISLAKREITTEDLMYSILLPAVQREFTLVKAEAHSSKAARMFKWLSENPLSDTARKITIFVSFAVFSLADIFTS
ncbi:hypothetical protein OMA36_001824 [Vibrio fluvialis]|nr:hypothetical protein [Vibrio fluvialis]